MGVDVPINSSTKIGRNVQISCPELVNIYGATIGDDTRIGPFVEIQRGAVIGARCKIQSHSFICDGVTIEDGVFIGHNVVFTNDIWPRAVDDDGAMIKDQWTLSRTLIRGSSHFQRRGIAPQDRRQRGAGRRWRGRNT